MAVHRVVNVFIIRKKDGRVWAGPFSSKTGLNCHITQHRGVYSRYRDPGSFEVVTLKCEEENVVSLDEHERLRGKT